MSSPCGGTEAGRDCETCGAGKPTEPEIVYQYKNGTFSGSGEGLRGNHYRECDD